MQEYRVKAAIDAVNELSQMIDVANAEIASLKKDFGVVQKLKEYPDFWTFADFKAWDSFRYSTTVKNNKTAEEKLKPEDVEAKLTEWFQVCQQIEEENKPKIQANQELFDKTVKLLETIGVSKTVVEYKGRSNKRVETTAAWYYEVSKAIPRCKNFPKTEYDEKLKWLQDWRKRLEQAKVYEEQQARETAKENEKLNTVAFLRVKYKLDPNAEAEEVLEHLLNQDKYLHLAHFLQKNRGDWNDGPSYAECGLRGFSPETPEDEEIYQEIQGHISDWQGDGRIFRDCTNNYSVLFEKCPNDLYDDYQKIYPYLEQY